MRILSIEAFAKTSRDPFNRPDFQELGVRPIQWEAIMRLDVNPEEADLLKILLEKDIGETHVEAHHTKNSDFKLHLQAHEKLAQSLFDRLKTSN